MLQAFETFCPCDQDLSIVTFVQRKMSSESKSSFCHLKTKMKNNLVSFETSNLSIFDSMFSLRKSFSQASTEGFGTKARNVAKSMSVGDVVVPLCANLAQRQILANRGIYAGVEYKVCSLRVDNEDFDSTEEISVDDRINVIAKMKPAYKLRKNLERSDWPVEVNPFTDVPLWLSKVTYEAGTLVGTLGLSLSCSEHHHKKG